MKQHVDDFIDFGSRDNAPDNENYARWILCHFRMSAICQEAFKPFMKDHLLFCTYRGKRYRVTGASRLGDVWLAKNHKQEMGYDFRVDVTGCTNWSPTPENKDEDDSKRCGGETAAGS